jgi:hypothetical protein
MVTVLEGPGLTVISPDFVRTSRLTGPLTWKERSKVPMTDAKLGIAAVRREATTRERLRRFKRACDLATSPITLKGYPDNRRFALAVFIA